MDEVTIKLQKMIAQRQKKPVVYNHLEHKAYARKQKSTSFDSYYSSSSERE